MEDRWAALLRGVNVGGKNKLPMKDLAGIFVSAGCRDVSTYIQSGNVVFGAGPELAALLPDRVRDAVAERFGFTTPVILRRVADLRALSAANLFLREGADPGAIHVVFLAQRPDPGRVATLEPDRSPGDRFVVVDREVFLHCPNGLARTRLTNAWFDQKLGTVSTVRNWKTVLCLSALGEGGRDRLGEGGCRREGVSEAPPGF